MMLTSAAARFGTNDAAMMPNVTRSSVLSWLPDE
jgi:hypothetical protein